MSEELPTKYYASKEELPDPLTSEQAKFNDCVRLAKALAAKDAEVARVKREKSEVLSRLHARMDVTEDVHTNAAYKGVVSKCSKLLNENNLLRHQLTAAQAENAELREKLVHLEVAHSMCDGVIHGLNTDLAKSTAQLEEAKTDYEGRKASEEAAVNEANSLRTALADAEKARDAAKADTERMDWLEQHGCATVGTGHQFLFPRVLCPAKEALRSAIDAARSTPPAP